MSAANSISGAGSQPGEDDGAALEYMELPKEMRIYSAPALPEPEDARGIEAALGVLARVRKETAELGDSGASRSFDITGLDAANRAFVDQALGEGEVSIIAGAAVQVQESVLAGVWRVRDTGAAGALTRDRIEAGAFPGAVLGIAREAALETTRPHRGPLPAGVLNATALVTELDGKIAAYEDGAPAHVINLTLLPLTDEDLAFLEERLGPGSVTILSRGYGNCRITSTATRNAWWVRYFNSRDAIVLNTIEVVDVPEAARAAPEDLKDSARRLGEILEAYL